MQFSLFSQNTLIDLVLHFLVHPNYKKQPQHKDYGDKN
jgi:hypothetical protein